MLSFSPIIADLILQDLERVLDILRIILPFYIRYVDDIMMAAPIELIEF